MTADIRGLAASLGPLRLSLLTLISAGATAVSLIAAHDLWERSHRRYARAQVALFNLVSAVTVTIGVATLYAAYAAVFVVSQPRVRAVAAHPEVLGPAFGHRIGHDLLGGVLVAVDEQGERYEASVVGPGCDDQFEFALDLLLDGIDRLRQQEPTSTRSTEATTKR